MMFAVFQSTLFKYFPLNYLQPDFLLIMAVYLGFKREPIEGGIFMILGSLILEAHSSAGRYFLLTCYLYTFVIAKILSLVIVVPNRVTVVLISMALSVLWKVGIIILLSLEGRAGNGISHFFVYLIPGLITQAIATPLCFHWMNQIDLKTYKDAHSDDEYDINREF